MQFPENLANCLIDSNFLIEFDLIIVFLKVESV